MDAAPERHGARVVVPLADGWRFALDAHAGAERPGFDDRAWAPVSLPHTWDAGAEHEASPVPRRGEGWYRRTLTVDPALVGRRLWLRFAAANPTADVYVDGTHVGRHVGGYTAFACDVTKHLGTGGPHVVAVRVDDAHDPDMPPLIADFTFYRGLHRGVTLLAVADVHLALDDHGGPGAWVETVEASAARARACVRGAVANDGATHVDVEVVARVSDPDGRELARGGTTLAVSAGATSTFATDELAIVAPRLWSPDAPHLHTVRLEVRAGGATVDELALPLGLRWFAVDPERGLALNGAPLRLRGTNRHQDRAGLGSAVPDALHVEDVERIHDDGFTFVRLAHYPQAEAVLDACDRLGLVVWQEIPLVNRIGDSPAFAANARRMLVEMIRQHRHHPSLLFWGLANEVLLLPPDPRPVGYAARVAGLVRSLHETARAEDPSRLTAVAVSLDEVDDGSGVQEVSDVLGLNLYLGWYSHTLDDLGPWLDAFHARHPQRSVIVSEYGAGGDPRLHAREPRALDFSAEYQRRFHEAAFTALEARTWLVGSAVWNHFDFGSRARDDTTPNLNNKGLYRFDRSPKDVAWFYRARLAREPVLHLAVRDAPRRAGSRPGDETHEVAAYSNLDEVELLHDGRALGRRRVVDGVARWAVDLHAGANALEARGTHGGGSVVDQATLVYEDRSAVFGDRPPARFTLAANASTCQVADAEGTLWEPMREYVAGGWGFIGGAPALTRHRIAGTADPALFQSSIDGLTAFRADLPDGDYLVELRFAEGEHERAGERVFDVTLNGGPAIAALDLAGEHGRWVAVRRSLAVRCAGGEGLRVTFTPGAGRATLSALRITRD